MKRYRIRIRNLFAARTKDATRERLVADTRFDRNRAAIRHGCPTISITSETGQSIPRVTTIVFPRDYCHVARVCE